MEDSDHFEEYMDWLMVHAIDYNRFICNGDMLLELAENYIGWEDFCREKGYDDGY